MTAVYMNDNRLRKDMWNNSKSLYRGGNISRSWKRSNSQQK